MCTVVSVPLLIHENMNMQRTNHTYTRPKQTILEAEGEAARSKHAQVTLTDIEVDSIFFQFIVPSFSLAVSNISCAVNDEICSVGTYHEAYLFRKCSYPLAYLSILPPPSNLFCICWFCLYFVLAQIVFFPLVYLHYGYHGKNLSICINLFIVMSCHVMYHIYDHDMSLACSFILFTEFAE